MSIYGYLCCRDCKEAFHVKDENFSNLSVDPSDMGEFLEKHMEHRLIYIWDETEVDSETPSMDWERYEEKYSHPPSRWCVWRRTVALRVRIMGEQILRRLSE